MVDVALDGAFSDAQGGGDFADGEVLDAAQQDHRALAQGERGDGVEQVEDEVVILRAVQPAADAAVAARLLRLQHDAYAVEAALIGDDRIPPLHEDLEALRATSLRWLAAFDGDELLGALGWTEDDTGVDIDRLMVAVHAHRRGVGTRLVREVLLQEGGRSATVSTGRDNGPARALYEQLLFTRVGDREVLPGLWVVDYRRPSPTSQDIGGSSASGHR